MRSVFDLITDALDWRGAVIVIVLAFNSKDDKKDVDNFEE